MRVQFSALSAAFLTVTALACPPAASANGSLVDGPPPNRPVVVPSNLEVAPVFRPFVDRMWQSSPTFKRQCGRLAAAARLRVSLIPEYLADRALSSNARTVLRHQDGSLVAALVHLRPSASATELIAHEMEHILEQLDGVDLQMQAGNGVVWKSGDGTFETRRAIEVGQRVAREVMMGSNARDGAHGPFGNTADRLTTVIQQDPEATPSSLRSARVSGSGRHVVFISWARLVEADRNEFPDVYGLDFATGQYTLESAGPGGVPGNGASLSPDISRDGRYVVFESVAGNLSETQFRPGTSHVFLRDREQGSTQLLTATENGGPANGSSRNPAINAEATAVVFESAATDLLHASDAAPNSVGVCLIRLTSGLRARLDLSSTGGLPSGQSASPAISADGRFVAFMSKADLTCGEASACVIEPPDRNGVADIYLRDTQANTTRRITRSLAGGDSDGPSYHPAISGDGRHVVFVAEASNLTRGSRGRTAHVYAHDVVTGTTELVSRTPSGRPANGASVRPALSHDGSRIAFQSLACDLVCEGRCDPGQRDINLLWDVFVHDRSTRRTIRASASGGEEWMENSRTPSLNDAGDVLVFGSRHPINGRDEAYDEDLYIYRRP